MLRGLFTHKKFILSGLVCFLFILAPFFVQAQMPTQGDTIQLLVAPEFPRTSQRVTVKAQSFSTNLDSAEISWYLDGALQKKAIGDKVFEFVTGKAGNDSQIEVRALTENGTFRKAILIRPVDVDILWDAGTYTPPFYQGKALYTHQADITFVAMPSIINDAGVMVNPKNLLYTWKKDGTVLADQSGYGKNALKLTGSIISKPINIRVEVSTTDQRIRGSAGTGVTPDSPIVLLYEEHPLYGVMYQNSLGGDYTPSGEEVTLTAVPYYFQTSTAGAGVNYDWAMNGDRIETYSTNQRVTLRNDSGATGSSIISVTAKSIARLLQGARAGVTIQLTGPDSQRSAF